MQIVCDRLTRRHFYWPAKKLVVRAQNRIVIVVQEQAELAGVVAQLVERLVRNQQVRGSNPLGSTILRSEPTLGGFERRMVSSVARLPSIALASEGGEGGLLPQVPSYGWQAILKKFA